MSKLDNDIRQIRYYLQWIDNKGFPEDIAKLEKEEADSEKIKQASSLWAKKRELQKLELDRLLSQKLTERANKLDVPLPDKPSYNQNKHDWDDNEHWYPSPGYRTLVLTQQGREYVDDAIWRKEQRIYFRSSRWVAPVTGLIGTIIGLVSVIANYGERFAAMFSRYLDILSVHHH
jgi:hypothetical protein